METMELQEKIKAIPYWYHKIELPGGIVTPGWSPICAEKYAIPDDMTGMRVLDIGAWDGYWTWEALKRGAKEVVAIDDFSDDVGQDVKRNGWETFDLCREAFGFDADVSTMSEPNKRLNSKGQTVSRLEMSIYDIERLGKFDIVFFFGTIYHLKHPLLALEKISAVCDGEVYIESAICDDYSPYRGGLDRGYNDNNMVMEFYPNDEYGINKSNWWVPTLQTLAYMVQSVGFDDIDIWRLTENPKDCKQCRGYVYGSKKKAERPRVKEQEYTAKILKRKEKVKAVMSVPRIGFMDNLFSVMDALYPLHIPLLKMNGVYWGQCLERGMMTQIDSGADIILTIDYDTVFGKEDLLELIYIMREHPEVDALVPCHVGRQGKGMLCSVRSKSGQRMPDVPKTVFERDISSMPIATGHFGLTLIRTEALMKMDHPWFMPETDKDGQWGRDRIDEDINFWRKFSSVGNKAYLANRVTIGHLEQTLTWPGLDMTPVYQVVDNYKKHGKPKEVWR